MDSKNSTLRLYLQKSRVALRSRIGRRLHDETGLETLEYVSLMSVTLLLGVAVYIYVSGGIGVVIDHIASIIDRFIAGYAAGW